jgi:Ala-tRNA(Pro) deacylase
LHVPGVHVAKTVLLRANGGFRYVVAVIPATARVDLQRVSCALGGADVRLATEFEIAERCPDCDFGVLPPFGSQFAVETIVDHSLAKHEDLFFEGDTHAEAIRMRYSDFYNLEHPLVMSIIEGDQPHERASPPHVKTGDAK